MPNDLSAEQWTQLLSVLSMDLAGPFYESMGVPVADPVAFRRTLREVITDARRSHEAAPGRVPPVAANFASRLPRAEADALLRWARGAFLGYHADQPEWSAWDIVFSHWAYSRQKDLGFLPQPKREWLVDAYRRDAVTDDVRARAEAALDEGMSDWDLEMYARRGYGAAWESSPFSRIESICRVERLKGFAAQLWSHLAPAERERLHEEAQALLTALGVWMPGPLPRLDTLPGGPR